MVDLATPDEIVLPEDDAGGTTEPLTDLLELVMVKALEGMSGRVYGLVDTYDAASGRVSITPLVPVVVDGVANPFPKLPSVPVEWPQSGTHSYKFPIAAGAIMTLSPLSHDHSRWLTAGTAGVPPTDERRFSLADLVARPWAPSPTATPPSPLSYDAAEAVLFGPHKIGSSAATKAVALNGDIVNKGPVPTDSLAVWMTQVEAFINGLVPLTVSPLSTTFTQVGTITATATKAKAE